MKIIQVEGIYENGQIRLLESVPVSQSKVMVSFFTEEKKPVLMNENLFWEILDLLDFQKEEAKEIIRPCINRLMDYEAEEIFHFEEILSEKLYSLDGRMFADHISELKKYFSADSFLYFRCGALVEGKDFYYRLLKNPSCFSEVNPFEPVLSIAERAYRFRFGSSLPLTKISYETYSNQKLWV